MAKQKMKKVQLTDEEYKFAVLSRDETIMQLEVAEFNQKMGNKAIELGLPQRSAQRELDQKAEELVRIKMNKKYYDKLVRDKSREVPEDSE